MEKLLDFLLLHINLKMFKYFQEYVLKLKATTAIKKGDEIFTRYTPPQLMSLRRQFLLQNQWYFSCQCRRCLDPTECDTMGNSIICSICQDEGNNTKDVILPRDPRDLESEWVCGTDPSHIFPANEVKALIAEIEANIKQLEKVIFYQRGLEFISIFNLYSNHLITSIELSLCT